MDTNARPMPEATEITIEDRIAPRFTLLIRPAKLVAVHAEFLCVIRDVSVSGICVRLFHPVVGEGPMMLEMQNGECYPVHLVWQDEGEAGFRFAEPIDVETFIRHSGRYPKRALRFCAQSPVSLLLCGARQHATLKNISQQGALIECDSQIALDQTLKLESAFLPDIEARVRWRADGHYGLVFDTIFGLPDMAAIVSRLHDVNSEQENSQRCVAPPQPGSSC